MFSVQPFKQIGTPIEIKQTVTEQQLKHLNQKENRQFFNAIDKQPINRKEISQSLFESKKLKDELEEQDRLEKESEEFDLEGIEEG